MLQDNDKGPDGPDHDRGGRLVSRRRVFIFLLLMSLVSLTWIYVAGRAQRIYKLVMPGTYRVFLNPGTYVCWYFWIWTSKEVHTELHSLKIAVLDENRKGLPLDVSVQGINEILMDQRAGQEEFMFEINRPGYFEIACEESCVAVIVPSREQFTSLGSRVEFPGADDDDDFEPLPPRKRQEP